jgi:hypothetical protein
MNEQALRQLLMDADAAAGTVPSTSGSDLASLVHHRLRRRRQSQVAGASLLLCAMFAIVPFIRMNPKLPAVADQSKAREELSMIRLQANSQAATVNRLVQYQHSLDVRAKAARQFDRGQPLNRLQQQRESAARLLTQDGEFRRVIQLFSETHWATVARRRLQT